MGSENSSVDDRLCTCGHRCDNHRDDALSCEWQSCGCLRFAIHPKNAELKGSGGSSPGEKYDWDEQCRCGHRRSDHTLKDVAACELTRCGCVLFVSADAETAGTPLPRCGALNPETCCPDGCAVMADEVARRAAETAGADDADRIVAYKKPPYGYLWCRRCNPGPGCATLTADDLPDGGICNACGGDVLIEPECAHESWEERNPNPDSRGTIKISRWCNDCGDYLGRFYPTMPIEEVLEPIGPSSLPRRPPYAVAYALASGELYEVTLPGDAVATVENGVLKISHPQGVAHIIQIRPMGEQ